MLRSTCGYLQTLEAFPTFYHTSAGQSLSSVMSTSTYCRGHSEPPDWSRTPIISHSEPLSLQWKAADTSDPKMDTFQGKGQGLRLGMHGTGLHLLELHPGGLAHSSVIQEVFFHRGCQAQAS